MDAAAKGRKHADPPVAELVAAALDDNRAVIGHDAGRRGLIREVAKKILGGLGVEIVMPDQAFDCRRRWQRHERAHELADSASELQGPADAVRLPERHLSRFPWRRRDEDAIVADLLDPPARGAEQERFADAALEDHLFVELADAGARPMLSSQEDTIKAAIGNRPAIGDRDALGAFARREDVGDAVPGQARPQIGEIVRRVSPRQHVEHAFECAAAELGERRGVPHGVEQAIDRPLIHGHHGDHLLRENVQRIPRVARAFDARLVHGARDCRARDEVAAKLRDDDAAAGFADGVARSADALHAARHRRRRLDLDDEIDRAHVDAELERRSRDEAANLARLQAIFDLYPLRPRQRAVVRADQDFAGELVQRAGEPLRNPPAVDEDERRAVRLDQVEESRVDRGPDRRAHGPLRRGAARYRLRLADLRHVLDRDFDFQIEPLLLRRIDDGDIAILRCGWRR